MYRASAMCRLHGQPQLVCTPGAQEHVAHSGQHEFAQQFGIVAGGDSDDNPACVGRSGEELDRVNCTNERLVGGDDDEVGLTFAAPR